MNNKRNVWFLCVFMLGHLVSTLDYFSRTYEDLDRSIEVCGGLIDAFIEAGQGGRGLVIKINESASPNTFRITRHTIDLEKLLSAYVGKSICVRYVKSPLLTFLNYPVEVHDKNRIIISSDMLLPLYLDRAGEYLFFPVFFMPYLIYAFYKRTRR